VSSGTRWQCPLVYGDFSSIANKIYDPTSHALAADGKTITATLFAGNILPQNRISPIAAKYIQFYPQPNVPGRANGAQNFITTTQAVTLSQGQTTTAGIITLSRG
jgi:hypothetical protein